MKIFESFDPMLGFAVFLLLLMIALILVQLF